MLMTCDNYNSGLHEPAIPQDSNLVTLKNTKASAIKQDDGSILCTHELLCSVRKCTIEQ